MFTHVVVNFSWVELLKCLGVCSNVVLRFLCRVLSYKRLCQLIPQRKLRIKQHGHLFLDPEVMSSFTREFFLDKTYYRVIIPIAQRQLILRQTLRNQNFEAEFKPMQEQGLLKLVHSDSRHHEPGARDLPRLNQILYLPQILLGFVDLKFQADPLCVILLNEIVCWHVDEVLEKILSLIFAEHIFETHFRLLVQVLAHFWRSTFPLFLDYIALFFLLSFDVRIGFDGRIHRNISDIDFVTNLLFERSIGLIGILDLLLYISLGYMNLIGS